MLNLRFLVPLMLLPDLRVRLCIFPPRSHPEELFLAFWVTTVDQFFGLSFLVLQRTPDEADRRLRPPVLVRLLTALLSFPFRPFFWVTGRGGFPFFWGRSLNEISPRWSPRPQSA